MAELPIIREFYPSNSVEIGREVLDMMRRTESELRAEVAKYRNKSEERYSAIEALRGELYKLREENAELLEDKIDLVLENGKLLDALS